MYLTTLQKAHLAYANANYISKGCHLSHRYTEKGELKKKVATKLDFQKYTLRTPDRFKTEDNALGLLTGEPNNIIVLDIDDLTDWYSLLKKIDMDPIDLDIHCMQTTAKGGRHYIFKLDEDLRQLTGVQKIQGFKVDIRTTGNFIYLSPTEYRSKGRDGELIHFKYTWNVGHSILDHCPLNMPEKLKSWLLEMRSNSNSARKIVTSSSSLKSSESPMAPNLSQFDFAIIKEYVLDQEIPEDHINKISCEQDKKHYRVDFNCKKRCYHKKDRHTSNHQYMLITLKGSRMQCHDSVCHEKGPWMKRSEGEYPEILFQLLKTKFCKNEEEVKLFHSAREQATINVNDNFPGNKDININADATSLTGALIQSSAFVNLGHNIQCDGNMLSTTSIQGLQMKCTKCEFQWPYKGHITIPPQHKDLNKYFYQINININNSNISNTLNSPNFNNMTTVNNYNNSDEVPLSTLFPVREAIFNEDTELNVLMHDSLTDNAAGIAKVFVHIGKDKFGIAMSEKDKDDWRVFEDKSGRWVKGAYLAEAFCNTTIAPTYKYMQKWYNDHTLDPKLQSARNKHISAILKRIQDQNKAAILHEAAILYKIIDRDFENKLDSNKTLLAFNNGVFDLAHCEFRPLQAKDYITLSTNFNYPSEITIEREDFLKWLKSCQPDAQQRQYIIDFLTSCLDGYNQEEIFTIMTGTGRNGKGVLSKIMTAAFGDYALEIKPELLTRPRPDASSPSPELMYLKGKRWVNTTEPKRSECMNEEFLKFLTGNDTISGRLCHDNANFRFEPQHSLTIEANKVPRMDAEDEALYLRCREVNWPFQFKQNPNPSKPNEKPIDTNIKKCCCKWAPQVMKMLCENYKNYLNMPQGLQPTEAVRMNVDKLRRANDPYATFIQDYLIKDQAFDGLSQKDINATAKTYFREMHVDYVKRRMTSAINNWLGLKDDLPGNHRFSGESTPGWLHINYSSSNNENSE